MISRRGLFLTLGWVLAGLCITNLGMAGLAVVERVWIVVPVCVMASILCALTSAIALGRAAQ